MKGRILNIVLVFVLAMLPMAANAGWSKAQQAADQPEAAPAQGEQTPVPYESFASSPVLFIENAGQWGDGARFQVWGGPGGTVWLAEDAIWIAVMEAGETSRQVDRVTDPVLRGTQEEQEEPAARRGVNVRLSFVGANSQPRMETFDRLDTTISYFIGNDPEQWRPEVPVWGGVRYVDLYPGIDLELTQQDGQMMPRLAVRAGANLSAVQLRVEGAEAVEVTGGWLRLRAAGRDYALPLLQAEGAMGEAVVQPRDARIFDVSMPFAARSTSIHPDVPADNPAGLLYSTFLGSSGGDYGYATAVDEMGNAYVTGDTGTSGFPTTPGAFDTSYNGYYDAFVVKLNPVGSGLIYATFLGGNNRDVGFAITLDGMGRAY